MRKRGNSVAVFEEARLLHFRAANLLMMTGVLRALKERKLRCPQDVEVMSSDDSEWLDVFEPRISTVAQPSYLMGAKSAELLLKRIKSSIGRPRLTSPGG